MLGLIVGPAALGVPAGMVGDVVVGRLSVDPRVRDRGRVGVHISARTPLLVVVSVALFALTGLRFGESWSLPAFLVFDATMVILAVVDVEHLLLPRRILYPGLLAVSALLVLATVVTGSTGRLTGAVVAGIITWAVFGVMHLVRPGALGFGDVRLAGLLGLALGWLGPTMPGVAVLVGCVLAIVTWAILAMAGRVSRSTPLPFGTFLAAGAVVAVLWV